MAVVVVVVVVVLVVVVVVVVAVVAVVVVVVGGTRSNRRSRLLLPHLVEALVAAGHSGATRHLLKSPTETWKGRQKETQTNRHTATHTHRHMNTERHRNTETQTHRHTDTETHTTHIETLKGRLGASQAEVNTDTHSDWNNYAKHGSFGFSSIHYSKQLVRTPGKN